MAMSPWEGEAPAEPEMPSPAAPKSHVPLNFDMRSSGVGRVRRVSAVTRQKNGIQNVGLRHFGLIAEIPNPTYTLS